MKSRKEYWRDHARRLTAAMHRHGLKLPTLDYSNGKRARILSPRTRLKLAGLAWCYQCDRILPRAQFVEDILGRVRRCKECRTLPIRQEHAWLSADNHKLADKLSILTGQPAQDCIETALRAAITRQRMSA